MSGYFCPCAPGCTGPMDPRHSDMRARAAAATDMPYAQPFAPVAPMYINNSYPVMMPSGNPTQLLIAGIIDDVLTNLDEAYAQNPVPCFQFDDAYQELDLMGEGYSIGTKPVPLEIAHHGTEPMQAAATYECLSKFLTRTQIGFTAPEPKIAKMADTLRDLANETKANPYLYYQTQQPAINQGAANMPAEADPSSASDAPKRPGLSIIQPSQDADPEVLQSMARIPGSAGTMTIGNTTTLEAVDRFDLQRLQIPGVDSIKVLHPLVDGELATYQSPLLGELLKTLVKRVNKVRYGRPGGVQATAVMDSVRVVATELHRRDIPVPEAIYSIGAAHMAHGIPGFGIPQSMFGVPAYGPLRQPSIRPGYGPQRAPSRIPSHGPQRAPSFVSARGQFYRGAYPPSRPQSMAQRKPSVVRTQSKFGRLGSQAGIPTLSQLQKQGTRMPSIFDTKTIMGSGQAFSEHVSLRPGREMELQHPLAEGDLPLDFSQSDADALYTLLDRRNRQVSSIDMADPMIAAQYKARDASRDVVESWLKTEHSTKKQLAADAMDMGAGGISVGSATPRRSSLRVPTLGASEKGERSVSFNAEENSAPLSGMPYARYYLRTPSMSGIGRRPSHASSAGSSRIGSFINSRTNSSGYVAAYPNAHQAKTVLAQHEAEAQNAPVADASVTGLPTSDSGALNLEEQSELKNRAVTSTDELSNAAYDGSDAGFIEELKSELSVTSDDKDVKDEHFVDAPGDRASTPKPEDT